MTRKINYRILWLVVFLILWFLSLGIIIEGRATYYPEGIWENEDITIFFDIETRDTNYGVPYLLTYVRDSIPYNMKLRVTSKNMDLASFHITNIGIKYEDATGYADIATRALENFKKYMQWDGGYNNKSRVFDERNTPMSVVEYYFENVIQQPKSGTLKIEGYLFTVDNKVTPINIEKELKIRKMFGIYPVRLLMAVP